MRVLIAGVGNVFLGDDGFGVEVAAYLGGVTLPDGVEAADFGIRGVHLAFQLLEGYDALVLVDSMDLGEPAGTLAVVEPSMPGPGDVAVDAHSLDPASVLATLAGLGGHVEHIRVIAVQPASIAERMGLSPAVAVAVESAAQLAVQTAGELIAQMEVLS